MNWSLLLSRSLWNGIRSNDAALILQDADPFDLRAVEFQANTDAAAVLVNENRAGLFERGLERVADFLVRKTDTPLELFDDQPIHTRIAGELFTRPFDQGASGAALGTSDHRKIPRSRHFRSRR